MAKSVRTLLRWRSSVVLIAAVATVCGVAVAQKKKATVEAAPATPSYYGPQPAVESLDLTMYARIRAEGLTHGKVMQFGAALALSLIHI